MKRVVDKLYVQAVRGVQDEVLERLPHRIGDIRQRLLRQVNR